MRNNNNNFVIAMVSTGWTAKERTAVDVGVVESDAITLDTLWLDTWWAPFVGTHFLQQTNEHALNTTNWNHLPACTV